MEAENVEADSWTFVSLLKACGGMASGDHETADKKESVKARCLLIGKKLHAEVIERGLDGNIYIGNTLVDMYANCGSMVDARHVFDNLPQRNVVSWNAIIAGYAEQNEGATALDLYDQMRKVGMLPNNRTFVGLIQACGYLANIEAHKAEIELKAKQLHEDVAHWGFESDTFVGNSLIHLYAKWGRTRDAREVFDKLSHRDVVSWNTMIVGYAEQEQGEMSIQLYSQMQEAGVRPDEATFQCILRACSTLGALQFCRQVDNDIVNSGLDCAPSLAPTLIHAYGKCGSMQDALKVFRKLPKRDLVAWNALLGGYSRQGEWKPTLQYFEVMQLEGVRPDDITYLAVFAACSHAGMVDKGLEYYESMVKDHGINVTRNHFASLIDLLGRAGLFADAEKLLLSTPVQPDLSTWTALLGACRTYNNVEVARRAFQRAVDLEPHDTGSYVLMSSIYASAGMWEDERNVRELRMSTGTWKKPGRSWIEAKNKVHVFLVGDKTHQQSESIYAKLKELTKQMGNVVAPFAEGEVEAIAQVDASPNSYRDCEPLSACV